MVAMKFMQRIVKNAESINLSIVIGFIVTLLPEHTSKGEYDTAIFTQTRSRIL